MRNLLLPIISHSGFPRLWLHPSEFRTSPLVALSRQRSSPCRIRNIPYSKALQWFLKKEADHDKRQSADDLDGNCGCCP